MNNQIVAPEGSWIAACERRPASFSFHSDLAVKLNVAELNGVQYLICNGHAALFIFPLPMTERDPLRRIDFKSASSAGLATFYITSHSFAPRCGDDYDLLLGMSNGEVKVLSLRAQLASPGFNIRPVNPLSFNSDGSTNPSRCVSVSWVPSSKGSMFVAAYADGGVYLYQKLLGNSSDSQLLARSNSEPSIRPPILQLQAPKVAEVAAAVVSPDGQLVAVACKDGRLRLYGIQTSGLVGGFKSYYGGLLCCAWSPDGAYVAAGGEDDLVAVYSIKEHCVVAFCEGHSSWVTAVAFDPKLCQLTTNEPSEPLSPSAGVAPSEEEVYRLVSVGQDCQVHLWDVYIGADSLAGLQPLSPVSPHPGLGPSNSNFIKPGARGMPPSGRAGSSDINTFNTCGVSSSAQHAQQHGNGGQAAAGRGGCVGSSPRGSGWGGYEVIAPSVPRRDMPLTTALAQQRVHSEPLSDVLLTEDSMLLASHDGTVQKWHRPASSQAMDTS